jgi:hypothetical protein
MANRDRLGEIVDAEQLADVLELRPHRNGEPPHDAEDCTGWAGEDYAGRPIICSLCRADTLERLRRQRRRLDADR